MRAGGVGGVAWLQTGAVQSYSYGTGSAEVHVPLADHMGNVRHYYQFRASGKSVTGQLVASYEYDAFGREVRAWGLNTPATNQPPGLPASRPWADLLPFHYSSKLRDVDSGFNYYGYRFYDPSAGRWLNRDPLDNAEMLEGPNVYRAFRNAGTVWVDTDGRGTTGAAIGSVIGGGIGGVVGGAGGTLVLPGGGTVGGGYALGAAGAAVGAVAGHVIGEAAGAVGAAAESAASAIGDAVTKTAESVGDAINELFSKPKNGRGNHYVDKARRSGGGDPCRWLAAEEIAIEALLAAGGKNNPTSRKALQAQLNEIKAAQKFLKCRPCHLD
jgi:RHS repeat-associated protein